MSGNRRNRIARVAAARDSAGDTPTRRAWVTYWCTRDSRNSIVSDIVRIWLRAPERIRILDDVHWAAFREDGTASALYGEWTLAQCERELRTVPDDDRQCVRRDGWFGVMMAFPAPAS